MPDTPAISTVTPADDPHGASQPVDADWSGRAKRWAWALVATGVVFRVIRCAANRSLWLDEAYLAESILTYSVRQLATTDLLHWQAAPAGFLLLEKLAVTVCGTSEYALRLVPQLASLASVPLFYAVVRRSVPATGGLVALAMFAAVEPLVYYAGEVKQYGVDVAVCLLILWLSMRVADRPAGGARLVVLALCSCAAVFLSHPALFPVASAGLVLAASFLARGLHGPLLKLLIVGALWAAVVAANYVLFLRPLTRHPGLEAYWARGYMPRDLHAAPWLGRALHGLFADYGTMWLPLPDVAAFAAMLGVAWLWRRDRQFLALLMLPVVLALAAAALHRFPFSGRLVLFLVPGMILLVAAGAQAVFDATRSGSRLVPALLVLVLLGPSAGRAVFYAAFPPGREEMKPVLAYVRDRHQPGDTVYVFHLSDVPFRFYRHRFGLGHDRFGLADVEPVFGRKVESTEDALSADLARVRGRPRVWVLLTHTAALGGPDETAIVSAILDRWGTRLDAYSARGALVLLYDLTASPSSRP